MSWHEIACCKDNLVKEEKRSKYNMKMSNLHKTTCPAFSLINESLKKLPLPTEDVVETVNLQIGFHL